jgi:hypothetical protein
MQMESYWLTPTVKPGDSKFCGGLFCPLNPRRDFKLDFLSQLDESDLIDLKRSLSQIRAAPRLGSVLNLS